MKSLALILNYDRLGGAEKSGLEQASLLKHAYHVEVYKPLINKKPEIEGIPFAMPRAFFHLSRSKKSSFLFAVFSLVKWILLAKKIELKKYDKIWFNGLKVFVLYSPFLRKYQGDVYFHLRDYIVKNKIMHFLLGFLVQRINLIVIANSNDIKNDFSKEYGYLGITIETCYNPCHVSLLNEQKNIKKVKTIGLASMLTHWKGIHMIINFAHLYQSELKTLGIEGINIYGDAIYKTGSGVDPYKDQLYSLKNELNTELVKFRGKQKPHIIFDEIDLLIHPSIQKEPFGRVILESMGYGLPVLSTGIGGSKEILASHKELIFTPYDYQGLFEKIKAIALKTHDEMRELQKSLYVNYKDMNKSAEESFLKVMEAGND